MIGILCSRFSLKNSKHVSALNSQMGILHFDSSLLIRYFSSENLNNNNNNNQSFTVSYLINSFGFNSKTAESLSKRVYFETPKKPDSVLLFLKDHQFTISQISTIVRRRPQLLLANPETSLLPKLQFLRSIGASSSNISEIVISNPGILCSSLDKHVIPCYDILKEVLVSDEKVIKALKRMSIFLHSFNKHFIVNVSLLSQIGTSQSVISSLVAVNPAVMSLKADKFAEGVKKIMEIGFDTSKFSFAAALSVYLRLSEKTWENKLEVYRRCGFSEGEIWSMFRRHPVCLAISEKNLMSKMHFLVCKMGLRPADVARNPTVLNGNLETRIKPRCVVARVLLLKGLIKSDISLSSLLLPTDGNFLKKFVFSYQEQVPQLLDLYQGKVSLGELGLDFDEKSGNLDSAASQT